MTEYIEPLSDALLRAYRQCDDVAFNKSLIRLRRMNELLDSHRRFHSKVGCPGRPECLVCADEEFVATIPTCEHGIEEGDWCAQCNADYKAAARDRSNHDWCADRDCSICNADWKAIKGET